jgi:DNA polymerase-3 subunit beta
MAWLFEGVRRSVSTDDSRYNLLGVFVEARDEQLRFVSSDGHRLSLRDEQWSGPAFEGIVPTPALKLAAHMTNLRIGFVGNKFVASGDGCTVQARCVEGKFPDYAMVIPKEHKHTLSTSREGFIAAIKRVALMAKDAASTIRCTPNDGKLLIEAVTPQVGEAHESVDIEVDGTPPRVGINASYLVDALESMECSDVTLRMGDDQSPIVACCVDGNSGLFVIMPIRL